MQSGHGPHNLLMNPWWGGREIVWTNSWIENSEQKQCPHFNYY